MTQLQEKIDRENAFEEAEHALEYLSDKDKVNFALKLVLSITDAAAMYNICFAAGQMGLHADTLKYNDYNREYE